MDSGQLRRMTSLNSTNAGHTSENGRTNGGCGWLSVEGHGRSWRTPKGDRSAKTCARLWGRIPEEYRQAKSFSDFWKSSEATASPSFRRRPQSPAGWKVQWRVGPRRTVLRATAAEAGAVCPANASGLPVRTNAPPDDETVRGVVQRSHHLISTRYLLLQWGRCWKCLTQFQSRVESAGRDTMPARSRLKWNTFSSRLAYGPCQDFA
ncbi:hypothetical protein GGP98_002832 [Salinibacter ruber]|nr:hypothetical protein [Salinibacter ruber]